MRRADAVAREAHDGCVDGLAGGVVGVGGDRRETSKPPGLNLPALAVSLVTGASAASVHTVVFAGQVGRGRGEDVAAERAAARSSDPARPAYSTSEPRLA